MKLNIVTWNKLQAYCNESLSLYILRFIVSVAPKSPSILINLNIKVFFLILREWFFQYLNQMFISYYSRINSRKIFVILKAFIIIKLN